MVMIHANTLHLSIIVQDLNLRIRISAWDFSRPHKINMLGWHQYPSALPKGFHEGSDEVMLALYNLNEMIFKTIVAYPFKVYNYGSEQHEYKKNSFMKFFQVKGIRITKYTMRQDIIDQQSRIFRNISLNLIKC